MTSHDDNGSSPVDLDQLPDEAPAGIDRRSFMMRTAMIGAVTVLSGCKPLTPKETAEKAASAPPIPADKLNLAMSDSLAVVRNSKGPVMTTVEEFYVVDHEREIPAARARLERALPSALAATLIVDTPAHLAERLTALAVAGANYFIVYLRQLAAEPDQLTKFAREVVPRVLGG